MGKKRGFTLAEIIITLTIVGVIAATTIPVMVTNIQDQQYRTAWKRVYSQLDQATRLIISDKMGIKNICTTDRHNCLMNLYKPYLSYTKTCTGGNGTFLGNCWHQNNTWKYMNDTIIVDWDDGDAGMILNSGILLDFVDYSPNCTYDKSLNDDGTFLICGVIYADVNGFKPPNIIGKDVYKTWIRENGLAPAGTQGDEHSSGHCTKSSDGYECSAEVIYK